ncbi:MAG: hypothetical protein L3J17_04615 [Candidatus Jettenia sp.]|nr:MAG: hypothetical protein L3J17_04615 [Candidatus Jettenia sp.]
MMVTRILITKLPTPTNSMPLLILCLRRLHIRYDSLSVEDDENIVCRDLSAAVSSTER